MARRICPAGSSPPPKLQANEPGAWRVLEFPIRMRYLDLGVILIYLIAITWFGARFRTAQKSLKDYFLGGRSAPWWAISLSIISAETSTLTVVGTPALSFTGNLGFLQLIFGYLVARIVISLLLVPHYFRGEMFTAYELMRRRFGERTRKLAALIFLLTRRWPRVYAYSPSPSWCRSSSMSPRFPPSF